ncbi:uncharacterized protein Dwil_GK11480 [Drosophila willistoni]|uniref:TIL domain-containing protein n=1 Tax=Drosophila willistoni TaxID=7260 RepID=B4N9N2_DROWI|nr:uncharacterized protein LOC6647754 [Drosophila willistoni]EDW80597.1 uncharacterized protein Dwil_GK11480 [Drosophila willistoni]
MKQKLILLALSAVFFISLAEGGLLGRLLHRHHSNETEATTTTETSAPPLFINNNLPQVGEGCVAHFSCSKKLTQLPVPHPCVKYCLKRIDCPNNEKMKGKSNQCVELNEAVVLAEHDSNTEDSGSGQTTEKNIMQVAMIDFPCQPGYLPDSRGRCREIW